MSQNPLASSRPAVLVEMSDGSRLWLEAAPRSTSKGIHLERHLPAAHTAGGAPGMTLDGPVCRASGDGKERATCQDAK